MSLTLMAVPGPVSSLLAILARRELQPSPNLAVGQLRYPSPVGSSVMRGMHTLTRSYLAVKTLQATTWVTFGFSGLTMDQSLNQVNIGPALVTDNCRQE
jgi:hypothetical protein